jgi:hypothetical protein
VIVWQQLAQSWVIVFASTTLEEDGGARTIATLILRMGLSLVFLGGAKLFIKE